MQSSDQIDTSNRSYPYPPSSQYAEQPSSQSHYADHRIPYTKGSSITHTNQFPSRPVATTPNQYYFPLRPLGNHTHNNLNASYSSPPIPLYPTGTLGKHNKHHPAGDHTTSHDCSFRANTPSLGDRSEYLVDGRGGGTSGRPGDRTRDPSVPSSLTSQYYPHTNLMPVQQSSIPRPPLTSSYQPSPNGHYQHAPVPMQPLRPNNLPYPSSVHHPHNLQPLVSRSTSAGRPSSLPLYNSQFVLRKIKDHLFLLKDQRLSHPDRRICLPLPLPPAQLHPEYTDVQLSDKQILRARFAQRGVILDKTERIGSGRYSKVMTAGLKNGTTIAIKIINTTKVTNEFRTKFLPREIECWEKLRHSHLIKLLYRDEIGGRVFLFMEYGSGGDMLAHVQKNGPVHEATASLWMRQIISGISYMHKLNLVHRDLKLENIIIFSPTTVKIADFGFARRMGNDLSVTYCGSKSYSAPEILSGQPYNPYKADVWSMGVIAYVIVTDRMPFKDSMPNAEIVNAQKRRLYSYPPQLALSAACRHTIDGLLVFEPQARPSISESSRMPWFVMPPTPSTECGESPVCVAAN
ncbi:hypothetical protein PRIPAC_87883 [Pristionchus pacificus]|uniref:Protein kinase domain-containing protein n=1 Tax=Pristionchus pacificus TaxID=54126 RepID=A0A2A6B7C0_PRIPA|nr:hypothetical protein PRIPAC_87883 [Pristionchus pacificus]|eukprot:PDM61764.1 protein kinase [Pristionchus pacificus]